MDDTQLTYDRDEAKRLAVESRILQLQDTLNVLRSADISAEAGTKRIQHSAALAMFHSVMQELTGLHPTVSQWRVIDSLSSHLRNRLTHRSDK